MWNPIVEEEIPAASSMSADTCQDPQIVVEEPSFDSPTYLANQLESDGEEDLSSILAADLNATFPVSDEPDQSLSSVEELDTTKLKEILNRPFASLLFPPDVVECTPPPATSKSTNSNVSLSWDNFDMHLIPTPKAGRRSLAVPDPLPSLAEEEQGIRRRISLAACLKSMKLSPPGGDESSLGSPLLTDVEELAIQEQAAKVSNWMRESPAIDRSSIHNSSREELITLVESLCDENDNLKAYIDEVVLRVIDICPILLEKLFTM